MAIENSDHIYALMAKCLSENATEAELKELHLLVQNNAALREEYASLSKIWHPEIASPSDLSERATRALQLARVQETLHEPIQHTSKVKSIFSYRVLYTIAAVAAVFLGVFLLTPLLFPKNDATADFKHINVPNGTKTRLLLPDGSSVRINSGSVLKFNKAFGKKGIREVWLDGEAFFDVAHDAKHPFIVHAGKFDVRVLGTAFNVKSYDDEKVFETTLLRGKVEINEVGTTHKKVYLLPNQKFVVEKPVKETAVQSKSISAIPSPLVAVIKLDTTANDKERYETAWMYNRLEFKGESFEQLASKMERWFNIKIHFQNNNVRHTEFYGSFEGETVEEAFKALQTASSYSFTFKIKGDEIFIREP